MGTAWAFRPCDHVTDCCCPESQEGILILITSLKKIKIQEVHQRTNSFKLWCWTRLLSVPWTARRSNQSKSILKEINPEYSLEGVVLKLKLQYFGTWCKKLTHWERPWWWERLKAGEEGDRGWNGWMTSLIQWTWFGANSKETVKDRGTWNTAVHGITKSWTQVTQQQQQHHDFCQMHIALTPS